jgi:GntR family transcriptional regulator
VPHQNQDELLFEVDDTSDLPIWVQLRNRFAYLIRTGHFAPGEQIPSVRSLSTSARINYNTVTKAYKDLEQSDLIVSIRGRGMYVNKNIKPSQESPEQVIDILAQDCVQQYRAYGMTYEDIHQRIQEIITLRENQAADAAQEKREY